MSKSYNEFGMELEDVSNVALLDRFNKEKFQNHIMPCNKKMLVFVMNYFIPYSP